MNMEADVKIEGILFYKAEPVGIAALASYCDLTVEETKTQLDKLADRLQSGATRLLITESDASLVTAPSLSELIESIRKTELKKDIGKAGAETLAIVLYKGPVSRSEINRIRGVNSGYIIRNLAIRGLIERSTNPKKLEYQCTTELFQHLGITNKSELPEFTKIMNRLTEYESDLNEIEN